MVTSDRLRSRRSRLASAWIVATVSTVVAATGHALAGGGTPSLVALVLALFASALLGTAVVGSRLSRRGTVAGVVLDQVIFHTFFSFFGASTASSSTTAPLGSGAHHAQHTALLTVANDASGESALTSAMVLSHLAAAVLAYAMLRGGVAAIAKALATIGSELRRSFDVGTAPTPISRPRLLADWARATMRVAARHLDLPDRRGPPAVAAA
jgi:hypothetical protein